MFDSIQPDILSVLSSFPLFAPQLSVQCRSLALFELVVRNTELVFLQVSAHIVLGVEKFHSLKVQFKPTV